MGGLNEIMENFILPKHDLIVPVGKVLAILQDIHTGHIRKNLTDNMVLTAGKNALADRLIGTTTNNRGIITYCGLGTGITAPVAGNTDLETELFRKLISTRSVVGNIATFQTFFTATEVVGTLTEAGLFGDDASGTANSGTLFCRTLINRVKTSSDTLTLVWTVTIG